MGITSQLLFLGASGAISTERKLEAISNNIANVNTSGYKKQGMLFKTIYTPYTLSPPKNSFNSPLIGYYPTFNLTLEYVGLDEDYTDFSQGILVETNNELDLAINGKGFFVVEDNLGNKFLTRDGSFKINNDGFLVTSSGMYVLAEEGRIQFDTKDIKNFEVSEEGVIYINKIRKYQIIITDYTQKKQIGQNLWSFNPNTSLNAEGIVKQGFLEKSNVNVVYEMVKMIEAHRQFTANTKIIETADELLNNLNDFGRL